MDAALDRPNGVGNSQVDTLNLPEIEFVRKFRLGRQVSLLRPAQSIEVLHTVREVAYGRTSFDVLELATGDRIMIVDRKLRAVPGGITGVLETTDRGHKWQWHSLLASFEARKPMRQIEAAEMMICVAEKTAKRDVAGLKTSGLICRVGSRRKGRYRLS